MFEGAPPRTARAGVLASAVRDPCATAVLFSKGRSALTIRGTNIRFSQHLTTHRSRVLACNARAGEGAGAPVKIGFPSACRGLRRPFNPAHDIGLSHPPRDRSLLRGL
jgi:hypothetical protein